MIYRRLGRTELLVSQLGFGAMRLPMRGEGEAACVDRDLAIPMMHRAFALGVNYIDTAVGYCNRDSQCAVGEALKGWRDSIIVSTKNHYFGEDEGAWWTNLEESLERLQVDYVDIYNHHGINWQLYAESVEPRVSRWMQKAKDQKLIRHICTSFHDDNAALIKLIDSGYPDVITLQYNMLDRQLEPGIAHAYEQGVGVVVMGPIAGGRLGATSKVLETLLPDVEGVPELALRFVLANPQISVALSGMGTLEQVEENVATASEAVSLQPADHDAINRHLERLKAMADLYCSGCGYCQPCPEDVNIPLIFDLYNTARVYGFKDAAQNRYAHIGMPGGSKGLNADACIDCGDCETKCPQNLPIREQLQQAHHTLSAQRLS